MFRWCVKYHQSKKENNCSRISALKKVVDKYNYENVNFPASLQDIEQFDLNNNISFHLFIK